MILLTDASNIAVALGLAHEIDDDLKLVYLGFQLKLKKNYSTLEKEALAIFFSVKKLTQHILGNRFILGTDYKPLICIFVEKKNYQ